MLKCKIPAKKESKTWANYTPTNSRSCLDWYYCDHKSGDYPLRDVSGQGKPEPHYEDGTFNACAKCNQQYLNKAKKNGERYVFFFTKYVGLDKDLREKFGKKYCITGYYEISGWKEVTWEVHNEHYNNTGKAVKCEDPHFYSMKDSYPLEKIDGWNNKWERNPRYASNHLSAEDTEKILKHFSDKKNRILDYRRETKNLYL